MDMKNLLKPHQILLLVALILAGVQVAVYFLLLKPQSDAVQEITESIDDLRSTMKSGKWPWDNVLLEKHLKELRKEAGGDAKGGGKRPDRLERARKMMGGTFHANIQKLYDPEGKTEIKIVDFMANATRLDYQAEYDRVDKALKQRNIFLSKEVLGIGPDAQGTYMYQMLMRIWTVEKLCQLAAENELAVCMENGTAKNVGRGRGVKPIAHIVSYLPRAYYELPISERPYLIDFPVEIDVEGTLEACMDYLHALDSDTVCMPPIHYEIISNPPTEKKGDDEGWVKLGKVRMRLVCSSYLTPEYTFSKK